MMRATSDKFLYISGKLANLDLISDHNLVFADSKIASCVFSEGSTQRKRNEMFPIEIKKLTILRHAGAISFLEKLQATN